MGMLPDPKVTSHIRTGQKVRITRTAGKNDRHLVGRVTDILETEPYNKDGVEVIIDAGFSGYVVDVMDDWPTSEELRMMIREHETQHFELKSSFNVPMQSNARQTIDLRLILAREIVAFLNSKDGGYLCLGVSDEPKIVGLVPDYQKIRKSNESEWRQTGRLVTKELLRDTLQRMMDEGVRKYIRGNPKTFTLPTKFYEFSGKDVCLIKLKPQKNPFYVTPTKGYEEVEFPVRVGTTKSSLNIPDTVEYVRSNFEPDSHDRKTAQD